MSDPMPPAKMVTPTGIQNADESILTDGKVDLTKLKPIVFDAAAMCYRALGDSVGKAWGSGKALIK